MITTITTTPTVVVVVGDMVGSGPAGGSQSGGIEGPVRPPLSGEGQLGSGPYGEFPIVGGLTLTGIFPEPSGQAIRHGGGGPVGNIGGGQPILNVAQSHLRNLSPKPSP